MSSDIETGDVGPIKHGRLLLRRDPPRILPALDGGRRFADEFGHGAYAAETSEEGAVGCHEDGVYDNVAHYATTFSHRLCAEFSRIEGVETLNARLKALREQSGLSVRALATLLDVPPSTYAAYEDAKKFKKPIIPLGLAKKLADAMAPLGVDRAEVMGLAGLTGEFSSLNVRSDATDDDEEWVEVAGQVEAGAWRAQTEWPASERYLVRFGKSRYPNEQRFGLRMEGLSMNRTILPGSDLECLWVKFSPVPPKPGDLVIVERHMHDLVELTCKRLAMDGEDYILLCESTEPEFQAPIMIGRPDDSMFVDDEIRVVGIVLSAKLDLAPRDLSERRYRTS